VQKLIIECRHKVHDGTGLHHLLLLLPLLLLLSVDLRFLAPVPDNLCHDSQ
jgi:hypothetical protein